MPVEDSGAPGGIGVVDVGRPLCNVVIAHRPENDPARLAVCSACAQAPLVYTLLHAHKPSLFTDLRPLDVLVSPTPPCSARARATMRPFIHDADEINSHYRAAPHRGEKG